MKNSINTETFWRSGQTDILFFTNNRDLNNQNGMLGLMHRAYDRTEMSYLLFLKAEDITLLSVQNRFWAYLFYSTVSHFTATFPMSFEYLSQSNTCTMTDLKNTTPNILRFWNYKNKMFHYTRFIEKYRNTYTQPYLFLFALGASNQSLLWFQENTDYPYPKSYLPCDLLCSYF